jgi:hypothetical protein
MIKIVFKIDAKNFSIFIILMLNVEYCDILVSELENKYILC